MDHKLQQLICNLNVVVIYGELDDAGHAVFPPILKGTAMIFINNSLTDQKKKVILLHELGHVAKQRNEKELYNTAMAMQLKMEYGANRFMIEYLFSDYLKITGDEPRHINYLEFMRQNDIPYRDENIVKEVIANY